MNNLTELVIKIIRGNIKKYRLFFVCNVCAIAMFMSIVSLSHNTSLNQMDTMISSNVYAPMYLMGLFLCFFIPYTQQLFQIQTQKDYAVLMSIGMNNTEMSKCLLIENSLLALFSTIVGIVLGECLELVLIEIVNLIIGLKLVFQFHVEDIEFLFVYALLLSALSMGIGLFRVRSKNIYEQLMSARVSEEEQDSFIVCVIGIVLSISAIIILFVCYRQNSNIVLFSILLLLIGIYLILGNCRQLIDKIRKKYVFWASDWNYYYKRNRRIVFAVSILYFCMMYLLMMSAVTFPNFANNAVSYHPYDIAYSLHDNSEWIPDKDYMVGEAKKQQLEVTEYVNMKYINVGAYSVFDIDEVKRICERNYNCDMNEAIYVFCIVENDGYEHDISSSPTMIHLDDIQLDVDQVKCDVLFGNGCGTTDSIILVNHQLYSKLVKENSLRTLYAYNFSDDTKTKFIYQQLLSDLPEKNHWEAGMYPDISCKELARENAKQSSEFLLILLIYDSLLILFSIYIIIRFKFGIEFESEKHKVDLLRSLGSDKKNIKRMIKGKVYSIFGIPLVIASTILFLFSYGTNFTYGYGRIGILYGMEVILYIMIIIIFIAIIFSKNLFKRLV